MCLWTEEDTWRKQLKDEGLSFLAHQKWFSQCDLSVYPILLKQGDVKCATSIVHCYFIIGHTDYILIALALGSSYLPHLSR